MVLEYFHSFYEQKIFSAEPCFSKFSLTTKLSKQDFPRRHKPELDVLYLKTQSAGVWPIFSIDVLPRFQAFGRDFVGNVEMFPYKREDSGGRGCKYSSLIRSREVLSSKSKGRSQYALPVWKAHPKVMPCQVVFRLNFGLTYPTRVKEHLTL